MENSQKKVGKRALKQQAQECSQHIKDKIQPYFKYEMKIPKSEEHTGQLKFYTDNLLIRNLAVSTGIVVRSPKNKVFDYIDDRILQIKDNPQQVIDFFDIKKNIEAYANSFYNPLSSSLFEKAYTMESFSMFLLLERVQQVMEEEFLAYMNTPQATEETESDQPTEKQKQYIPFLHSVAIYEILIWEYFEERYENFFKQELESELEDEKVLTISQLDKMIADSQERRINNLERFYALIHLQNLFAIVRVVHTIETVQCNTGWTRPRSKDSKYASFYASVWREKMEKPELFCAASDVFREKDKNLYRFFGELNQITFENFVSIEETTKDVRKIKEKIQETAKKIKEYVKYIENKHNDKSFDLDKQKENFEEWFTVVVWLANTIFETTGNIFDIYSNVKSKKTKE